MALADKFKSKELPNGITHEQLNELTNNRKLNATEAGAANKGIKKSDECRENMRLAQARSEVKEKKKEVGKIVGRQNVESGHWNSLKTPEHQSKAGKIGGSKNKGKKKTPEMLKQMSEVRKGVAKTKEHRDKIGKAHLGMKRSEETKANMRGPRKKAICKYCGIERAQANITLYHNEKCKKAIAV